MTSEQAATIGTLKQRGYRVVVLKYAAYGVLLIRIKCRLKFGNMPLRVYPDGSYLPPWYDIARRHRKEVQPWQS